MSLDSCGALHLQAAAGLAALRLYVESAGKYGPGTGAFLLPYYGAGELPQVILVLLQSAGVACNFAVTVECLQLWTSTVG